MSSQESADPGGGQPRRYFVTVYVSGPAQIGPVLGYGFDLFGEAIRRDGDRVAVDGLLTLAEAGRLVDDGYQVLRRLRPSSSHSADAAPLSDRVIIVQASDRSRAVSGRRAAWASRSNVPRIVTLTTLAESKCEPLSSRHTTPAPGSSISTATNETRPRRLAPIVTVSGCAV